MGLLANLKFMEVKYDNPANGRPYVKFYLVSIAGFSGSDDRTWNGVSELLSPIRTMLSTREQPGFDAIFRDWNNSLSCESKGCQDNVGYWFLLDQNDFDLPLGWQLAATSRSVMEIQTGDPRSYYRQFTPDFTINKLKRESEHSVRRPTIPLVRSFDYCIRCRAMSVSARASAAVLSKPENTMMQ